MIVFHKCGDSVGQVKVSYDGELATAEQIDAIVTVLNSPTATTYPNTLSINAMIEMGVDEILKDDPSTP